MLIYLLINQNKIRRLIQKKVNKQGNQQIRKRRAQIARGIASYEL